MAHVREELGLRVGELQRGVAGGAELVLEALALADVRHRREHVLRAADGDGVQRDLDGQLGAVLAHAREVPRAAHGARRAVGHVPRDERPVRAPGRRRDEEVHGLAEELAARVAEEPLGLRVHVRDGPGLVDEEHAAGRRLDDTVRHLAHLDLGAEVPRVDVDASALGVGDGAPAQALPATVAGAVAALEGDRSGPAADARHLRRGVARVVGVHERREGTAHGLRGGVAKHGGPGLVGAGEGAVAVDDAEHVRREREEALEELVRELGVANGLLVGLEEVEHVHRRVVRGEVREGQPEIAHLRRAGEPGRSDEHGRRPAGFDQARAAPQRPRALVLENDQRAAESRQIREGPRALGAAHGEGFEQRGTRRGVGGHLAEPGAHADEA